MLPLGVLTWLKRLLPASDWNVFSWKVSACSAISETKARGKDIVVPTLKKRKTPHHRWLFLWKALVTPSFAAVTWNLTGRCLMPVSWNSAQIWPFKKLLLTQDQSRFARASQFNPPPESICPGQATSQGFQGLSRGFSQQFQFWAAAGSQIGHPKLVASFDLNFSVPHFPTSQGHFENKFTHYSDKHPGKAHEQIMNSVSRARLEEFK